MYFILRKQWSETFVFVPGVFEGVHLLPIPQTCTGRKRRHIVSSVSAIRLLSQVGKCYVCTKIVVCDKVDVDLPAEVEVTVVHPSYLMMKNASASHVPPSQARVQLSSELSSTKSWRFNDYEDMEFLAIS